MEEAAVWKIAKNYTKEAGVRQLERKSENLQKNRKRNTDNGAEKGYNNKRKPVGISRAGKIYL